MKKFILGLVCILGGCAAQNYSPENIVVENGNYIKNISSVSSVRPKDGFMKVSVSGETYEDTELYYRVVWFDADGLKIDAGVLDRPVQSRVRRNIPFTWNAIAPNASASSYKVYVSKRPVQQ
jgi:uncharacterized protein YcfL